MNNAAGALPDDQMRLAQDLEVEMLADLFSKMSNTCQMKCIPTKFREGDLGKGEAVCIDRCVAKYFEIHTRVGQKLAELSNMNDEAFKQMVDQQKQPNT